MSLVFKARDNNSQRLTPQEREVARIINSSANDMSAASVSDEVQSAIATQNVEQVILALPFDSMAETINQTAFIFGAVAAGAIGNGFPKIGFQGRFDYTDPRSLQYAQEQSETLVTNMTTQMQEIVRIS